MMDRIGQQLGNYRLLDKLGAGGFADVYLGEHVYLKTLAAIKVLRAQLEQTALERFLTEARTIAAFVHPHIVRVLDFGVEEGTPFLVMDYAPHGSLQQRYSSSVPLPPELILPHVQQVADALEYAHAANRIHRDIKPENLLLGRKQEVWLSDFGISVIARLNSQQRSEGFVGTPAYAAPEQLQGRSTFASDQYSLGVIVYEWLTGNVPFDGAPLEVIAQHVLTPPPPLRERVAGISPALEAVVLKALAKDPEARFASVTEFADALSEASQSTIFCLDSWEVSPLQPERPDQEESAPPGSETPVDALLPDQQPAPEPASALLLPEGTAAPTEASDPPQQETPASLAVSDQEPPEPLSAEDEGEEPTQPAAALNALDLREISSARESEQARTAAATRRSQLRAICLAALVALVLLPTLAYGALELGWIGQRGLSIPINAGAFAFPGTSPTATPSPTATQTTANATSAGATSSPAPRPPHPPAPTEAASIAFVVTPINQAIQCPKQNGQTTETITLDNTGSTAAVTWQFSFIGLPWAYPSQTRGSIPARQRSSITLTIWSIICGEEGGNNNYHANITYQAGDIARQVTISTQVGW